MFRNYKTGRYNIEGTGLKLEFRLRQNKEAHYCRLNALKDERSKTSDQGEFLAGFLGRENPFLTTGYRILGRRCFPLIQPSDLPRCLGARAGVPNTAKMLPKDWATRPGVSLTRDFCHGRGRGATK